MEASAQQWQTFDPDKISIADPLFFLIYQPPGQIGFFDSVYFAGASFPWESYIFAPHRFPLGSSSYWEDRGCRVTFITTAN